MHERTRDIAVVEGVMGLFDGYDGKSEAGSTAQMAKWLGLPVILLVDAASMARSAAAIVMGFEHFDAELTYAGVCIQQPGQQPASAISKRGGAGPHRDALFGRHPSQQETIAIPERHLGLVTQEDHPLGEDSIDRLGWSYREKHRSGFAPEQFGGRCDCPANPARISLPNQT